MRELGFIVILAMFVFINTDWCPIDTWIGAFVSLVLLIAAVLCCPDQPQRRSNR